MKKDSHLLFFLSALFGLLVVLMAFLLPQNHEALNLMGNLTIGATSALYAILRQQASLPDLPPGTVGTQTVTTQQTAKSVDEPKIAG